MDTVTVMCGIWLISLKWIETKYTDSDKRFKLGYKPGSMTFFGMFLSPYFKTKVAGNFPCNRFRI